MKRRVIVSSDEPEQRRFELPSEKEHHFQVVDKWEDKTDDNIIIVKLEVIDGDETGRTLLHRVNLDSEWKGFFLTRLFLKAIGEQYKGEIEIDDDMWIGKYFYAGVVHNVANNGKTYANISEFNFDNESEVSFKREQKQASEPTKMSLEERQRAIDNNELAWDDV